MINFAYLKEVMRIRKRSLLILLSLALLNTGLVLYAGLYQEPRIASLQREWASRRSGEGRILDRGAAFEQGSADLATWNLRIPTKKELGRVAGEIYESARANSLTIGGITYKPEKVKDEKLLAYSIALNVSGSYVSAKSFIADLGRLRDVVIVDGIALSNNKITEEMVNLKLDLTVYLKLEGQ